MVNWLPVVHQHWDAVGRNGSRQDFRLGQLSEEEHRMKVKYNAIDQELDRVIQAMELQVLMKFISTHT